MNAAHTTRAWPANRSWRAISSALALLLSACTLEPHYERPMAPIPANLPSPAASQLAKTPVTAVAAADLGWRDFFTDPALQQLITLALANNRDLRVSVLNIESARAEYDIQRAQLLPTFNATATRTEDRVPRDFTYPGQPQLVRYDGVSVGLASYEIDLFGKVRSLDHQALETYFGLQETRRSAQLSLIASVANAYFTVLADRALLEVTIETERSEQASFDLTRRQLDAGTGTELDLRQAETALLTAQTNHALYQRQLAVDTDALVLLLGTSLPEDLPQTLGIDDQRLVAPLPAALPSEVLTQRPDVLAAEHDLMAANANIGAARAAFFPSISLTGSLGSESYQLSNLFKAGSKAWSFVPQISLPLFTGGLNSANLELAKVEKNIQVATYEKTLQTAFREVADALASLSLLDTQVVSQEQLVRASQQSYHLADLRFQGGIDSYLSTLDAQRTLYTAQQNLVSVKLARLQNLVTTYQVLGGGWLEHSATAHANASVATSPPAS